MRGKPASGSHSTRSGLGKSSRKVPGIQVQLPVNRHQRRALERGLRKTKDAGFAKRCMIVLQRHRGWSYQQIAQTVGVAKGTVGEVLKRWRKMGALGLIDRREDNGQAKVDEDFLAVLWEVLERTPQSFGWPRPTWTIEVLIFTLARKVGVRVSRSTMSRALKKIGARKGRPKPVVLCPWSKGHRTRRLNQIRRLIERAGARQVVLWEDEVDIHLNPKIGPDWMLRGQQREVVTPGKNKKRYVAGAMNARTKKLTWVTGERKTSQLFIELILKLVKEYRWAKVIHLVLDNWKVHDSKQTCHVLEQLGGKVQLHFLPTYSPDENKIERVWKDLHDNVTRNHRYRRMEWLMGAVEAYLDHRNVMLEEAAKKGAAA